MILDFHTHIFPDKVAAKAIPNLASVIHLPPSMNGTLDGLKGSMEGWVDVSAVLPIVTVPRQFDSIFRFAVQINERFAEGDGTGVLSLAGVHPDDPDFREQLKLIAREGFKGIKLHPNYQGMVFDDIRYLRLIDAASEEGLFILTHTGYDPYTPDEDFCTPDMILHVIREVDPPCLILAHMGNNEGYDEAEEKLCGRNLYFDTAYSLMHMSEEQFVRMVHSHGADKVLFATDAPWTSQRECVEKIQSLTGLSEEEKRKIFWENGAKLLGIGGR